MVDLNDCRIELEPLVSGEMGEFHLSAHIDTDREVQKEKRKLFELFALLMLKLMANFIESKEIFFTLFLVVELHEIFTDLLHSILSILNRLDLLNCLLLGCCSNFLLSFLVWLLLLLLLLLFLVLLFLFQLFICFLSTGFLQPIFTTHHWVGRLQ